MSGWRNAHRAIRFFQSNGQTDCEILSEGPAVISPSGIRHGRAELRAFLMVLITTLPITNSRSPTMWVLMTPL